MVNIALDNAIVGLVGFLSEKWYMLLIPLLFFGIIVAIFSIIKLKKKLSEPQYWDQIKHSFKRVQRELEYNPSPINFIRHFEAKYKVLGHCFVGIIRHKDPEIKQKITHKFTIKDIRDLEIQAMKDNITNKKTPDYIANKFLIQRKSILFNLFYFGEKEVVIILDKELTQIKSDTLRIDDPRSLIWRKGFLCTQSQESLSIVDEMHERIMSDHHVDSRGQQMKDFSRIRSDYAHQEKMKDKDIEIEEKKERTRRMG